ncbi:unnamed protein product [Lymnaea stagnalis]|uniref:Sodium-dependent multivitamin transporter n=1 Tax=Lymnaea stagnalis TaxID=6523 RepID=A0AAV2HDV1_LYMST
MVKHHFHVGDFIVFGLTIVISIAIGIYYALSGGRQKTTSEYLVGGRTMSFIPVAISLLVSFESSIMMLGLPAEAYVFGIQNIIGYFGFFVAQVLSVHMVVPLLHPLRITSAYEYLELRFQSRAVRYLGTLMGMFTYVWYMGIVLFGPAVALEAVTGFPLWSSIFVISFVSVIYTTIGGLKAVVWTDVFQALVMFAGIFAILIKGTIDSGGPKAVWDLADRGGRLNFFNFDPDPRVRHTFWNLFFGALIRGFGLGFNQSTVQRISSTGSQAEAKKMLLIVAPCYFISLVLALYEGIVAYAFYETKKCDPFASKQLTDPNQVTMTLLLSLLNIYYFFSFIFRLLILIPYLPSSTLSSGLSSLSALLWADIVHPIVGPGISETKATIIAKGSVVVFGILASGVAIMVSTIGGTLTQISGSLLSAFAGPLTGLFFLGSFFPRVKASGAMVGGVIGVTFSFWLSTGITFNRSVRKTPWLPPASTEFCPVDGPMNNATDVLGNFTDPYGNLTSFFSNSTTSLPLYTTILANTTLLPVREPEGIEKLYTLSYNWISVLGTLTTVAVAMVFSLVTGTNKPGDVDPRYLISMSGVLLICLPSRLKKYIRSIGPQYIKEEYKEKFRDPSEHALMLKNATDIKITVNVVTSDDNNNIALQSFPNGDNAKINDTEFNSVPGGMTDGKNLDTFEPGVEAKADLSPDGATAGDVKRDEDDQ